KLVSAEKNQQTEQFSSSSPTLIYSQVKICKRKEELVSAEKEKQTRTSLKIK
ncbi:14863_t:CDS:1, partial [Gigaspora margarita]